MHAGDQTVPGTKRSLRGQDCLLAQTHRTITPAAWTLCASSSPTTSTTATLDVPLPSPRVFSKQTSKVGPHGRLSGTRHWWQRQSQWGRQEGRWRQVKMQLEEKKSYFVGAPGGVVGRLAPEVKETGSLVCGGFLMCVRACARGVEWNGKGAESSSSLSCSWP